MAKDKDALLKRDLGMTKQEVLDVMGKRDFNEVYKSLYGKTVVIYFYYTQRKPNDANVTKYETIPVVIENGKRVGWGDEF